MTSKVIKPNFRQSNVKQRFYTVDDVMAMLECSRTKAYRVMEMLNTELMMKGKLTTRGRVSKKYFDERYYG